MLEALAVTFAAIARAVEERDHHKMEHEKIYCSAFRDDLAARDDVENRHVFAWHETARHNAARCFDAWHLDVIALFGCKWKLQSYFLARLHVGVDVGAAKFDKNV